MRKVYIVAPVLIRCSVGIGPLLAGNAGIQFQPVMVCPKDFVQTGKVCLKVEYADFLFECGKNARLENGECLSIDLAPSQQSCPAGYETTKDKRCERTESFPAHPECERDFVLRDGQCVKTLRVDSMYVCPAGYRTEGSTCVHQARVPAQPTCAAGMVLRSDNERCERLERVAPHISCPGGYTRATSPEGQGEVCVRDEAVDRRIECEKGFRFEGNVCVRQIDVAAQELVCPPESELRGRRCEILETAPAQVVCRRDFVLNGDRCVRIIEEEPEFVCERGFRRTDEQNVAARCERRVELEGEFVCPPGTFPDGRRCLTVETQPLLATCPSGYEDTGERCIKRQLRRADFSCPRGFTIENDSCVIVSTVAPDLQCPPGSILRGAYCETTEIIEASLMCRKGVLENGVCVDAIERVPHLNCPRGFVLENDLCVTREYCKPERFCPDGGTIRGDRCEVSVRVPAIQSCPKGFVMGTAGRCQRAHATDARVTCPANSRYENGVCLGRSLR